MNHSKLKLAATVSALGLASLAARASVATLYDIQFGTGTHQTGAAIIGASGNYWNQLSTASGTASLLTSASASGNVSFTWNSQGVDSFASSFGGGDAALMGGYIDAYTAGNRSLSFTGLPVSQNYSLIIYTQGDSASSGRELSVTDGSTYTTAATVATATSFVLNQNYLDLTGLTDASGDINFTYNFAAGEADINGIQLAASGAPVPEPSEYALAGIGGLLVLAARRRQQRA